MAVRAVRGAIQVDEDDRQQVLDATTELLQTVLERNGLTVTDVSQATIVANVSEWFELMTAYHEAVLGWVGGTKRIEGAEPSEQAVRDRMRIMRHAIDTIFGGRDSFNACWTYITATNGG